MGRVRQPLEVIRSNQNSRVKQLRKYLRYPQSSGTPWVAVEGLKAIREVCHRVPLKLLVQAEDWEADGAPLPALETLVVDARILKELSQLESDTGSIAFFEKPYWSWDSLPSVLLFLDRLQDPGNLGTLMRCAASAGTAGIVCSRGTVSRFNAKAVRASAGTLFHLPVREGETIEALRNQGYRLVAACPSGGESIFQAKLRPPLAIAIGNEGSGLTADVAAAAERRIHIPVAADAPSLNAALAGAIILFEVRRRSEI